jgi:hypothetical protein
VSKKPSLIVPERRLPMCDGSMMLFRADHRAWYVLERHTGKPLSEFLAGLGESVAMSTLYDLAWCLSATGRMREQRSEDYDQFLDLLPPVAGLGAFLQPLMEMLTEAFGGADQGNAR